jgi:DNA repair protein RecO (recombination protein O)
MSSAPRSPTAAAPRGGALDGAARRRDVAVKRISDEPAYVLHRYDWSESSLILEVFHPQPRAGGAGGQGGQAPSSNFRPVLLPLQPLHVAFGGDAEIRTLKGAEWVGGHVMPTGDALLSGYYLNELVLRLLARDDPHPALFDAYAAAVQVLASASMARPAGRCCGRLSCCCCARSACCPCWTCRP